MRKVALFFLSHRTLALLRWDLHFLQVRLINFLTWRTGRMQKKLENLSTPVYLNLGSGPRGVFDEHWLNIDGFNDTNVDYLCNFSRRLPFNDNSFDGIFCEHVLEHFTYEDGRMLLSQCLRILKKGGVLRVIVPDGEKILSSYFHHPDIIVEYKQSPNGFPMEAVNQWFYQRYEHQCIYDSAWLIDSLQKTGFATVVRTEYKKSQGINNDIILDDPKYKWESLYIEAVK